MIVLSLVWPPLPKFWQGWQVPAGADLILIMWILLSHGFQLWSLAKHAGKNFSHCPLIQDGMTSSEYRKWSETNTASLSCGSWKGGDHKIQQRQVFVLQISCTDRCGQLALYSFISRTNKSRHFMWLVFALSPFFVCLRIAWCWGFFLLWFKYSWFGGSEIQNDYNWGEKFHP